MSLNNNNTDYITIPHCNGYLTINLDDISKIHWSKLYENGRFRKMHIYVKRVNSYSSYIITEELHEIIKTKFSEVGIEIPEFKNPI